jgi:hypothetical protein
VVLTSLLREIVKLEVGGNSPPHPAVLDFARVC